MAEYINREAAIAKLTALEVTEQNATMTDAKRVLADMQTADVVRVVRCKDCKYSEKESDNCTFNYFCHYDGCAWNNGDHFCGYGERDETDAKQ